MGPCRPLQLVILNLHKLVIIGAGAPIITVLLEVKTKLRKGCRAPTIANLTILLPINL